MIRLIGAILLLVVILGLATIGAIYAYKHPEKTQTQRAIDALDGTLFKWLINDHNN